ncbi:MAG: hypothetical protein LBU76_11075 [Azoarcus sp.]|jgi:hypothetical protein|nr:hypothetical protein [Azoarcus sp.]
MDKDTRDSFFLLAGFIAVPLLMISVFYIFDYLTYETKAGKELWVAKDKLLLAEEGRFLPATKAIAIEKNEACIPIRYINEKDFIYTEVLCEHGQGWVIGSSDFNVLYPKKTDLPR